MAIADWHGTDVDITTIERKLSKLWMELTDEGSAVRTHILNLVVFAGDDATADRVSGYLGQLAQRQPSRSIILVSSRLSPQSGIDAETTVECGDRGFCHEQIKITGRGRAADHLDSVVVPLLMPELPTYLWWPGQPPFGHRTFHRLLTLADQLVIDSAEFQLPGDGLANIARISAGRQGVNDFHWARLTPVREIIAQFFDGAMWQRYLQGIRSVRMEFGAGGDYCRVSAGALLLLGWLAAELVWEPETTLDGVATSDVELSVTQGERTIPVSLQFKDKGQNAAGRFTGIELVSQAKGEAPARFTIERTADLDHAHATTHVHEGVEIHRVVPMELKSETELLADELDYAGHDALYDVVADMASRLAGREVWIPA